MQLQRLQERKQHRPHEQLLLLQLADQLAKPQYLSLAFPAGVLKCRAGRSF